MALLMDHVGQGEALSRSPSLRAAPSPVVDSSTTHLQVLAITLSRLERLSSEIVGVADRTIPPHSPVDKPVAEDDMPGPSTVLAPERDSPYCGPEDTSELEQPSSCPLTPSHPAPQLAPSQAARSGVAQHNQRSLVLSEVPQAPLSPASTGILLMNSTPEARVRAAVILAAAREELQGGPSQPAASGKLPAPSGERAPSQPAASGERAPSPPTDYVAPRAAATQQQSNYLPGPLQLLNGVPFSETDQLRQQLQVAAAQISKAAVEASLAQMKHEQELRKEQWDHELEVSRMKWEHQEATSSQDWQHKQALKRVSPECPRLREQLQEATSRLLKMQDENRQLKQQQQQLTARSLSQLEACKERYEQQISLLQCASDTPPGSPSSGCRCNICMDATVTCVFRCGHAKCAECASRLVGLGQGCPDCRAPLDEPRMIYLNVG